jgi:hypothetical protein
MDPVVFAFASIESLLFFCVEIRYMHPVDQQSEYRYCQAFNSAALLANGNCFRRLSRAERLDEQLAILRPNV